MLNIINDIQGNLSYLVINEGFDAQSYHYK